MPKPAAIAAQLVDVRNVGMHKCIKLTLHVPAEQAGQVMAAFGWPTATDPVPVALARMTTQSAGAADPPAPAPTKGAGAGDLKERRPFTSLPLPQQAALLCQDPMFRAFLNEEFQADCGDTNDVAGQLRWMCGVESRAELNPDSEAGRKFIGYREQFLAWKLVAA